MADYQGFFDSIRLGKEYFTKTLRNLDPFYTTSEKDPKESSNQTYSCSKPKFRPIVRIISHYDADGLASAGILAQALLRERIPFQMTILKQLEEENLLSIIKSLPKYSNDFIIFSDFGTGQYNIVRQHVTMPYLILDHHSPEDPNLKVSESFHINPHFYGIDGTYEVSGAGVSYLFVKALNPNNTDLSVLALVGATGDIQTKGPNGEFVGLNLEIQKDAVANKDIEIEKDLNIDRNKFLPAALAYTLRVGEEIPGISKNVKLCQEFIKSQGIRLMTDLNESRTLSMLTTHEKQKLNSALLKHMFVDLHLSNDLMKSLFISYYKLKSTVYSEFISDTREFSSFLNACGRMEQPSIAIGIILGDRGCFEIGKGILESYKGLLSQGIKYAKENKQDGKNIVFINGKDVINEKIIGTITTILIYDREASIEKPIVSYAESDGETYKISLRCTDEMVNKGIDLSQALRNTMKVLEIPEGSGGHKPAAGAKIPRAKITLFLDQIDIEIGKQLSNIL